MLKYETALRLKEAGYPQEGRDYWVSEDDTTAYVQKNVPPIHRKMDVMFDYTLVPPLEELIEACGDEFTSLHKELPSIVGSGWQARSHKEHLICCQGPTPFEAVANLWITLNEKV